MSIIVKVKIENIGGLPTYVVKSNPSLGSPSNPARGRDLEQVAVKNLTGAPFHLSFDSGRTPCCPTSFRVDPGPPTPLPWKTEVRFDTYRYDVTEYATDCPEPQKKKKKKRKDKIQEDVGTPPGVQPGNGDIEIEGMNV